MIVLVNQKSIGKNKRIKTVPLEYKDVPENLYDLIGNTVKIMVEDFYRRVKNRESPLSEEQIKDLAEIGRVSFVLFVPVRNCKLVQRLLLVKTFLLR